MKKHFIIIISIILAAALCPRPYGVDYTEAGGGVLNVSSAGEEQVRACAAVMLDAMESDETDRQPDEGTVAGISASAPFESENCLLLNGNGSAGVTFVMTKKRNTSNTRSAAICVYVEPVEGASFTLEMCVRGSKKSFTASSPLEAGVWCAAYLPITGDAINLADVHVSVKADRQVRVTCSLDWLHTALVDGLPDKLPYFASDYEPYKGELKYGEDGMTFTPTGSSSRFESVYCGYLTNGVYNCITVRLINNSDAKKLTLRLRLDGQQSYREENSHTLELVKGEQILNFPIGGFRSGTTVEHLRFDLSGSVDGSITIKSVGFAVYRFPAEYAGTVKVSVTGQAVTVSGSLPDYPSSAKTVRLYRIPFGVDEEQPGAVDSEPYAEAGVSRSFSFELPRYDNGLDNSLFKYLVVYEGKNSSEAAGVAYAGGEAPQRTVPYKGTSAPDDVSAITALVPGAVYIDVDTGTLYADDGGSVAAYGGAERGISGAALDVYDGIVARCAAEGAAVVIRLKYSPSPEADKYVFTDGVDAIPDVTGYEGTAQLFALLRFFAGRYGSTLSAIVPTGPLDSEGVARVCGLGEDGAEKYACSVIRAASAALSGTQTSLMIPVTSDGAGAFLQMLRRDLPDTPLTVYAECGEDDIEGFLSAASDNGCSAVVSSKTGDAESLIKLFYGCEHGAAAICAEGVEADGDAAALFCLIDTNRGVSAADALGLEAFPDGVSAVYTDMIKRIKIWDDRGDVEESELPDVLTTLTGCSVAENWIACDNCRQPYADVVNGEPAVAIPFDLTSGGGHARCVVGVIRNALYLRLCADYLPEGEDALSVLVRLDCENGVVTATCRLPADRICSVAFEQGAAGGVRSVSISPVSAGGTPRISVVGVYTVDEKSSDTVPDQREETLPEPETQIFVTEPETTAAVAERGSGVRLYVITICVLAGMFLLCGAVIFILKKKDDAEKRKNKDSDTGEEN